MSEIAEWNAIAALPELIVTDDTFGELPFVPYEIASVRFAHDQAERPYPYVDGAAHEHTGLQPLELTTRFHFLNTLVPGIFPNDWNTWWEALQDGAPKTMVHPLVGERLVVVMGGDVQLVAQVRSGVVVDVTWRTTILSPEDQVEFEPLQLTLQEAAAAADAAMGEIDIDFPSGQVATSFTELLAQLNSFTFLLELQVVGVLGKVKQITSLAHDLVSAEPDLGHARTAALDALVQLYALALQVEERATLGSRPTTTILTTSQTTFDALVGETGNTLEELMALNIGALASPVIPEGTMIKAYG